MTLKSSTADGSVTLLRRIDAICDRFEDAWQSGQQPRVEDYLADIEPDARHRLAVELVKLDVAQRRERGETPTVADYADRGFFVTPTTLAELLAADGTPPAAPEGETHPLPDTDDDAAEGHAVAPPAGRFRPVRYHKKGGLGEVHLAEDAELPRKVALKRIQPHRAGDEASRARFLREAEITSLLEHPGIVPVYGLVAGPDGEPCYAMRFVEGDSLKDAIDRMHRLPPQSPERERSLRSLLNRFVAVCQAVAFAHSKGVIHRDLKPANVMLGQYGETYVVDWGLAKRTGEADATAPEGTARVDETAAGHAMGTPAYMAPEQARGDWPAVGPASDVYSLGATLYHLLAGQPPFAGRSGQTVTEQVKGGASPEPLRDVSPALAAVCRKAMAADAAQRFHSAAEVAAEVERWLADEPVTAYPEPAGVRLRRWVRKHARLVTGLAATLAVGVVSLGALAWQREQARSAVAAKEAETAKERDAKEAERANAAAERDRAVQARQRTRAALDTMFSDEMIERLGTQKELSAGQKSLLQQALNHYQEFAAEAATDEAGRALVANAHARAGSLLLHLGQRSEAMTAFQSAITIQERLAVDFAASPGHRRALVISQIALGQILADLGKMADATATFESALANGDKLAADFPSVPEYRSHLARSHNNFAGLLYKTGKGAEALRLHRRALAIRERLAAEFPTVAQYRKDLADSHLNLGPVLQGLGQDASAETAYRNSLSIRKKLADEFTTEPQFRANLVTNHINLANLLHKLGRHAEAEANNRDGLAIQQKLVADYPAVPEYRKVFAMNHVNLGYLLMTLGRNAEAESTCREAIAISKTLADDYPAVPEYRMVLIKSRNILALTLFGQKRYTGAESEYLAALDDCKRLTTDSPDEPDHRLSLAMVHTNLGLLFYSLSRHDAAEPHFQAALATHKKLAAEFPAVPEYRSRWATSHDNLGNVFQALGNSSQALTEHRAALAILEKLVADSPAVSEYAVALGGNYCNLGSRVQASEPVAALDYFNKAIAVLGRVLDVEPRLVSARQFLRNSHWGRAVVHSSGGRYLDALSDWDRALALDDGTGQFVIRISRAFCLARAARPADAATAAEELITKQTPADLLADVALVLSIASAVPNNPAAESQAAKAVHVLRQAFDKGYGNAAHILTADGFAALRRRDDFAALLWDFADAPAK